jgi:hypothetical protein
MPAPLGRATYSARRIIDPYASHYFAVPPACFAFLVWRFCLRVFSGAFFCSCFLPCPESPCGAYPPARLSTHLIVVSPAVSGKRHVFKWLRGGRSYVGSHRSSGLCWSIRSRPSLRPTSAGLHTFLAQGRRRADEAPSASIRKSPIAMRAFDSSRVGSIARASAACRWRMCRRVWTSVPAVPAVIRSAEIPPLRPWAAAAG